VHIHLKNFKSDQPCVRCGLSGDGYVTYHHIYTKKAYPEHKEAEWNLMPLCQLCHNKIHAKGDLHFFRLSAQIMEWMLSHGWYEESGKLLNVNM
jgi:5-methylcytosine-specific restriction endonuclease McrA